MPRQTSVQIIEVTERQVADLTAHGYGSFTDIVRVAIDRLHRDAGIAAVDGHSVIVHNRQVYGNTARIESLAGCAGITINGAEYVPMAGYEIVAGPAYRGRLPEIPFRLTDWETLPSDVPGTDGFYYQILPSRA